MSSSQRSPDLVKETQVVLDNVHTADQSDVEFHALAAAIRQDCTRHPGIEYWLHNVLQYIKLEAGLGRDTGPEDSLVDLLKCLVLAAPHWECLRTQAQKNESGFHQSSLDRGYVSDTGTSTPQSLKHSINPILDDNGSPVGELIQLDSARALDSARRLCATNQLLIAADNPVVDIVFYTDASARGLTESANPNECINEWGRMKANPVEWRSGVAIAWTVSTSSDLHGGWQGAPSQQVGSWMHIQARQATTFTRNYQLPAAEAGGSSARRGWRPTHEAAWQITGLQHFQQAELLGILFALKRAVAIFRNYDKSQHDPSHDSSQKTKTITILTDSKPAMWDLTGYNSRIEAQRTDSEYWRLRQDSTRKIASWAKRNMSLLKQHGVEVKIQWVPAHSSVPGNEWVDELSRFARLEESRFRPCNLEIEESDPWHLMDLENVQKAVVLDSELGITFDSTRPLSITPSLPRPSAGPPEVVDRLEGVEINTNKETAAEEESDLAVIKRASFSRRKFPKGASSFGASTNTIQFEKAKYEPATEPPCTRSLIKNKLDPVRTKRSCTLSQDLENLVMAKRTGGLSKDKENPVMTKHTGSWSKDKENCPPHPYI